MSQDLNQWTNEPSVNGATQPTAQPHPQATLPQFHQVPQQHYQQPQGYYQPTQFHQQQYRPRTPINWDKWSCIAAASFGFFVLGIAVTSAWMKANYAAAKTNQLESAVLRMERTYERSEQPQQ